MIPYEIDVSDICTRVDANDDSISLARTQDCRLNYTQWYFLLNLKFCEKAYFTDNKGANKVSGVNINKDLFINNCVTLMLPILDCF